MRSRAQISLALRALGYFFSGLAVVAVVMPSGKAPDGEPLSIPIWAIIGLAAVGLVFMAVGALLRFWPESEAEIRARFDREHG